MTKYRITSQAGADMGIYEGDTKTEALCALHKDAGYPCHVEDDTIIFRGASDAFLCGQVSDWHFDECIPPEPNTPEYQTAINQFVTAMVTVIEKHVQGMPVYEVANVMISQAVSMLLATAPNHLIAFKTAMACIETGIISYEDAQSPEDGE